MALQITSIPNISFESSNNSPFLEKIGGKGHHPCLNLSNSPCRNIMLQLHQISTFKLLQSTLDIQLPSLLTSLRATSNLLHIRLDQIPVLDTELYTLKSAPIPSTPSPLLPHHLLPTSQQRNHNAKLTLWHVLPLGLARPQTRTAPRRPAASTPAMTPSSSPAAYCALAGTRALSRRGRGR